MLFFLLLLLRTYLLSSIVVGCLKATAEMKHPFWPVFLAGLPGV